MALAKVAACAERAGVARLRVSRHRGGCCSNSHVPLTEVLWVMKSTEPGSGLRRFSSVNADAAPVPTALSGKYRRAAHTSIDVTMGAGGESDHEQGGGRRKAA